MVVVKREDTHTPSLLFACRRLKDVKIGADRTDTEKSQHCANTILHEQPSMMMMQAAAAPEWLRRWAFGWRRGLGVVSGVGAW